MKCRNKQSFCLCALTVILVSAGCSSGQSDAVSSNESEILPVSAQRLNAVVEKPVLPKDTADERKLTGIVSSVTDKVLRLDEDGQIIDYTLGKDVVVHYPGGVTDMSDLRRGDKVTIVVDEYDDGTRTSGDASSLVVTRMEKHTMSLIPGEKETENVERF